jgi:excinuclease ABC subunit C
VWAVNRTITALQRAFLLRSCTDAFFEGRTRPCLLYQIKRCSGPCTREIEFAAYRELVREANDFLSGKSRKVKEELAAEMEKASDALDFERAAIYRDRLAALSGSTGASGHQSARRGGGRCVRAASGGRLLLRAGVLLPHRSELGQSRLFSEGRPQFRRWRGDGRVPGAVL